MMKLLILTIFGILVMSAFPNSATAQSATDHNEGSQLEYDTTNTIWRFKWWGRDGRTYAIQHSEDLQNWFWVPLLESGDDSILEWGFTTSNDRFFLRLQYSDIPTTDPDNDDFDGDLLTNLNELQLGLNPFVNSTDGDSLPDGYEVHFGLDPFADDASGDLDGDVIPNDQDARPDDINVGTLSISISSPANGSIIP